MSVKLKKFKEAKKAIETLKKFFLSDTVAPEMERHLKELEECLKEIPVDKDDSSSNSNAFILEEKLQKNFEIVAFSDGACRGNPGPGAWGALVLSQKNEVLFEGSGVEVSTTNNRMELSGAIECLKFLTDESDKKISLVSDSKYVVDGITSWVAGWKRRGWKKADNKAPENLDLWQELDELVSDFSQLKFQWVKGHSGYPQNEYVDELANKALDEAGF